MIPRPPPIGFRGSFTAFQEVGASDNIPEGGPIKGKNPHVMIKYQCSTTKMTK